MHVWAMDWWGEAPERRVTVGGQNYFDVKYRGLRRYTLEPLGSPPANLSPLTNHFSLLTGAQRPYHPRIQANISGATIVASDSTMYLGVSRDSLPQVIFSFGTAPE